MKTWFYTKNDQILDLQQFHSFWIEEIELTTDPVTKVFGQDKDKVEWNMAEFEDMEDAFEYLWSIFEILTTEDFNGQED